MSWVANLAGNMEAHWRGADMKLGLIWRDTPPPAEKAPDSYWFGEYEKMADCAIRLNRQREEARAEAKLANERADAMQRSEASMKELIDKQAAEIAALKAQVAKLEPMRQCLNALAQADREFVSRESAGISRALNNREPNRYGRPLFERYY